MNTLSLSNQNTSTITHVSIKQREKTNTQQLNDKPFNINDVATNGAIKQVQTVKDFEREL